MTLWMVEGITVNDLMSGEHLPALAIVPAALVPCTVVGARDVTRGVERDPIVAQLLGPTGYSGFLDVRDETEPDRPLLSFVFDTADMIGFPVSGGGDYLIVGSRDAKRWKRDGLNGWIARFQGKAREHRRRDEDQARDPGAANRAG